MNKNNFVREQIKDKPMNKKKGIRKMVFSAICGLIFGLCAAIVFLLMNMLLVEKTEETPPTKDTQVQQQTEVVQQTETEEEVDTETSEAEPEIPSVKEWFTVENYQIIMKEVYAVGEQANKSVVTVYATTSDTDLFNSSYEIEGQTSGVLIGEDVSNLFVLTERKAIRKAKSITVEFADGETAEATIRTYDANTGLAILAVPRSFIKSTTLPSIRVIECANSDMVASGNVVIALGRIISSSPSVLSGCITSTENEVTTEDRNLNVFTTDMVAGKNANGILVNTKGQLVGIILQEFNVTESQNVLSAVAITDLKPIIDSLCKGNAIPYLGITCSTVTSEIANEYELPKGIYVKHVTVDSPAMLAGIQSGDIIVSVNDEIMDSAAEFSTVVLSLSLEESCRIVVKRQSGARYVDIICDVTPRILK